MIDSVRRMILATEKPAGVTSTDVLTHTVHTTPAAAAPVPSTTTITGSVATAAVMVLLITIVVARLAPQIGPAPTDGRDPCRWLAAIGIGLLAAAAVIHQAMGR